MRADHLGIAIGIDQGDAAVTPEQVHHRTLASRAEFGALSTTLSTFST